MAGTRECTTAITAGRLSKAVEFFDAAEHLEDDMPNAAGDLFVDAGVAASDVICCVRLGTHSNSGGQTGRSFSRPVTGVPIAPTTARRAPRAEGNMACSIIGARPQPGRPMLAG